MNPIKKERITPLISSSQTSSLSSFAIIALTLSSLTPQQAQSAPKKQAVLRMSRSAPKSIRLTSTSLSKRRVETPAATVSRKQKPTTGSTIARKGLTERGAGAAPVSANRLNGAAPAASTTTPGASTTASTAIFNRPSWAQNLSLSFLTSIDGPALNSLDNGSAVFNGIADQNFFTLGYRFKDGWSVSGTFDFSYSPARGEISLMDPFISVRKTGIVDRNGYRLGAQGRVYAPISADAQARNLFGLSRLTVDQSYSIGRWTLGLTTYAQGYFYNDPRPSGATRLKYLAEPSISYQASPKFSASLTYDMDAKNRYEQTWLEFGGQTTYLIPSVSWTPAPWISLEPSLILTPGGRVATDTTMINLSAMLTLL